MMKQFQPVFLAIILVASGGAQAASISQISATITFTLTDIQVDGTSATAFSDYEGDSQVEVGSSFTENFALGGTGSTSGSSSTSQNGGLLDPNIGGGFLEVDDTLTLTLNSQTTGNTGLVVRNQFENATFSYLNFTDDGFGNPDTLSFLFDYSVSYTTSLTNDAAGDQVFANFFTTIELFDDDFGATTIDLFPGGGANEIFEFSLATGTVTPGGMLSGSFTLDLAGFSGSFSIDAIADTQTSISAVPIPAAVWLFGSALGLLGWVRRRSA